MNLKFKEGMIFGVNLKLNIGHEYSGVHNILILANAKEECFIGAVVIEDSQVIADDYKVNLKDYEGIPSQSIVLLDQIFSIDKSRVIDYKGKIIKDDLSEVKNKLAEIFELSYCKDIEEIIAMANRVAMYEYNYFELKNIDNINHDILTLAKKRFKKQLDLYKEICAENDLSIYKYYTPLIENKAVNIVRGFWG